MHTATYCSTQQYTLQHTATHSNAHCNILQHTLTLAIVLSLSLPLLLSCSRALALARLPLQNCVFARSLTILHRTNRNQRQRTHCNNAATSATHYNTGATYCKTLFATYCNTLSCSSASNVLLVQFCDTRQSTATRCNTLQHTAARCNSLQHTATWSRLLTSL